MTSPIEDVIEDTVAELRRELARLRVSVFIPPDLPLVAMDPNEAGSVLHDMLREAAHRAPSRSELGIAASRWQDAVEIRVAGRPSEVEATGSLEAANAIVLAHGGQMWVESGGGAAIVVRLPAAKTA